VIVRDLRGRVHGSDADLQFLDRAATSESHLRFRIVERASALYNRRSYRCARAQRRLQLRYGNFGCWRHFALGVALARIQTPWACQSLSNQAMSAHSFQRLFTAVDGHSRYARWMALLACKRDGPWPRCWRSDHSGEVTGIATGTAEPQRECSARGSAEMELSALSVTFY
jgi:hypothetical protein